MSATAEDLVAVLRGGPAGPALRVEQVLATSAADLWEAITSPGRLSRWMAGTTLDGEPAVGARYRIDVGDGAATTGTVTRCEPPRVLEITWELAGEPDSLVRAEVSAQAPAEGERARLVLEHRRLPANQVHGHAAGWQAHLATLAAQLVGEEPPSWDGTFARVLPAYRAAYPDLVDG